MKFTEEGTQASTKSLSIIRVSTQLCERTTSGMEPSSQYSLQKIEGVAKIVTEKLMGPGVRTTQEQLYQIPYIRNGGRQ